MTDDEIQDLKEKIKEVLGELGLWTGHREMTLEEMAVLQPRLGSLMLEVGQRTWTLYYSAQAQNWRLARSQWEEIQELMEICAFARPKYEAELKTFLADDWPALGRAIENRDFAAFDDAFSKAIRQANAYHEQLHRPFVQWKLPEYPPSELDLTPRPSAGQGHGRPNSGKRPE